ncbi:MAG: hypothetical protein H0X71_05740 [Rubrobacter sp.]|nr:hypothetical protein [Rubrobacter sp.]
MPSKPSRTAASDYEVKISQETIRLARQAAQEAHAGPSPFGDPLSGITLVIERVTEEGAARIEARMADALRRSLAAVKLDGAYVTWTHPDLLEELLSLEPSALVAVGPGAARVIDSLAYPLAKEPFSEAAEGVWFAWTDGAFGLSLPALAPALTDPDAKRRFWRAFLSLRALATGGEPGRS